MLFIWVGLFSFILCTQEPKVALCCFAVVMYDKFYDAAQNVQHVDQSYTFT